VITGEHFLIEDGTSATEEAFLAIVETHMVHSAISFEIRVHSQRIGFALASEAGLGYERRWLWSGLTFHAVRGAIAVAFLSFPPGFLLSVSLLLEAIV
jgi:hypothetical protein